MFKKLKKRIEKGLEEKILKYAQKDINELSRILNRPHEGEIIKIKNIKIKKNFSNPRSCKMKNRREYYKKYKYFRSTVVLNKKNYLIDGYTTYLLAKEMGFDYITVVRAK